MEGLKMVITSSSPGILKTIKITITNGVKGQPISVSNRTNGDIINSTLGATGKAVVDLQNFANNYTSGDVIDLLVSGEVIGANSLTTSGTAPQSITVSTASIGTTYSRGI